MFLIHSSKENASIHISQTRVDVGGMVNQKERPWCLLLRISIFAHIQTWQNPTYTFSFPYILVSVFTMSIYSSVTCGSLCSTLLVIFCIAFCNITDKEQVCSGGHIQLWPEWHATGKEMWHFPPEAQRKKPWRKVMMEQKTTVSQLCFDIDKQRGGRINHSEPPFHCYF